MNIKISKKDARKIVEILRAYKINCELSDINFYGCNHPKCVDADCYKDIADCADKIEKQID